MWPECSTSFAPRMIGATAGWPLKSSSIWYTGVSFAPSAASEMVATRPSEIESLFV